MLASLPLLSSLASVDQRQPVEWSHPLNRGRVAWWLTLPQWYGGRQWYDLCGRNHGTLTNGPLWRPRAGGYGAVILDGSDDYVATPGPAFAASAPLTLAATVILAAAGNFPMVVTTSGGQVELRYNGGTRQPQLTNSGGAITSGTALGLGEGHRLLATLVGNVSVLYVDGVSVASGSGGSGASFAALNIGRRFGSTFNLQGSVDDVCLWSRGLSPAEVAADYALSRQGYPGVLRRPTGVAASYPAVAPVTIYSRRTRSNRVGTRTAA